MPTFPSGYNLRLRFTAVIAAGFVLMMKAFDSNTEPKKFPSGVRLTPAPVY